MGVKITKEVHVTEQKIFGPNEGHHIDAVNDQTGKTVTGVWHPNKAEAIAKAVNLVKDDK